MNIQEMVTNELKNEFEQKKEAMIAEAARVLHQNQECYVAQWILHNQDKNFNEYELSFRWREDGFGYNVFMIKKGEN